jgi:hypothetical protein
LRLLWRSQNLRPWMPAFGRQRRCPFSWVW